ncbi:MAG: hypothetical protein KGJ03_01920 [Betaproteobacteria bacterium]|nr:hypothetical protein [Betaproteobacteria bacterium]MDE1954454.1 hypothetical protein [Betaproteobacteria bacterium]MDE2152573.1 hypothetical protein [Betaproteobacteria bacterium]MDE2478945.1 hypothetical protein [Betaproteobacteria bacterium]
MIERARTWRRRAAPWLLLAGAAGLGGCVQAPPVQRPAAVVVPARSPLDGHPHLIAAMHAVDAQIAQLRAARNGDDGFGRHRGHAIQLALQARAEIYRAAVFADRHR